MLWIFTAQKRRGYDNGFSVSGSYGAAAREFDFTFRNADDIFKEFFGNKDPFEAFFGDKDPFKAFFRNEDPFKAVFTSPGN